METIKDQTYRFRGGIWIGFLYTSTWPFGSLEISRNALILRDEMFDIKYEFSKQDDIRIEIKKGYIFFARGIRIYHKKKNYNNRLYFWYFRSRFENLVNVLKEFGWMQ